MWTLQFKHVYANFSFISIDVSLIGLPWQRVSWYSLIASLFSHWHDVLRSSVTFLFLGLFQSLPLKPWFLYGEMMFRDHGLCARVLICLVGWSLFLAIFSEQGYEIRWLFKKYITNSYQYSPFTVRSIDFFNLTSSILQRFAFFRLQK